MPAARCQQVRILIADEQAIVRYGLKRLIEEQRDLCVAGEAENGIEALDHTKRLRPDVLLLDIGLPKLNGLVGLQQIAHAHIPVRIILLMSALGDSEIGQSIAMGVRGIFLKSAATELLTKCIRCVVDGEIWLDRGTLATLVSRQGHARFGLTRRETELVHEISEGSCNKVIAAKFTISEKTVKRHLVNIFDKLGVSSRLELAVFAMKHGLSPTLIRRAENAILILFCTFGCSHICA
jgi:DNA-binding NarL/FixJ family response regulator